MEPYELWHVLPGRIRSLIKDTRFFSVLNRVNDRLWMSDRYVEWRYTFEPIEIECDDIQIELWGPAEFAPWWREYDQHRCHEPVGTRAMMDLVGPGDTVWDLGSRFGYFSGVAATVNNSPSEVHTFEASPRSCRFVEKMSERCFGGEICVHNHYVGGHADNNTLSTYAETYGVPDFIKMDIEGAEGLAVDEICDLLESQPPVMLIEVHPRLIEQTGMSDQLLLDRLDHIYDDVRISFDFRSTEGSWHPITERWDDRHELGGVSGTEEDMCQILCLPEETL